MTAPVQVSRREHPVRPAVPPFFPDRLRWALEKVQRWQPYADGDLLDGVTTVLDDYMPGEDEVGETALRLRGNLRRLVALAITDSVIERDEQVTELVKRAEAVKAEELPGDHRHDVGHLRRMPWILNKLLERLVAAKCLQETA